LDPAWDEANSEYCTSPLFSACFSLRAALLRRRNHPSPASNAKAAPPPAAPPAIALVFDVFGGSVFTAGEAAAVVDAAAGCVDDEDVAAVFVESARRKFVWELDELVCGLDAAAVGFVFTASPWTR